MGAQFTLPDHLNSEHTVYGNILVNSHDGTTCTFSSTIKSAVTFEGMIEVFRVEQLHGRVKKIGELLHFFQH